MSPVAFTLGLIAVLSGGAVVAAAQTATDTNVVADVRTAVASRDLARGEHIITQYRSARGVTPERLEALSSLARGALATRHLDKADQYAAETRDLVVAALKDRTLDDEQLRTALVAAIETRALVLVAQGARSEAVAFLRGELETYRNTPIHEHIQGNIDRLSLEGRPALRVDGRLHLGPRVPAADEVRGKIVLLFFWAHWCADCKADSPTIARVLDKYRSQGLTIIAPTQRYGFVAGGRPAAPDKELRYLIEVRNKDYSFLRDEPVPVSEANYEQYGVASIPMYVLIDQQGIIRLYHAGRMTEEELEAAIRKLL